MIIKQIPNGYNSISEVLRSPEFKKFREENRLKPALVASDGETTPDETPSKLLERFLKSLEIRTFDDI